MKHLIIYLSLSAGAAFAAMTASAAPVVYWFTGVIDSLSDSSNLTPSGVSLGTPFVGRVSYEPGAVSKTFSGPVSGGSYSSYVFTNAAAFSFTVYIAGHTITNAMGGSGTFGDIFLQNSTSVSDTYAAETSDVLMLDGVPMTAVPNQSTATINLYDSSKAALNSTTLPVATSEFNEFPDKTFNLDIRDSSGSIEYLSLSGDISSISTNEIVLLNVTRTGLATVQLAWPLIASGFTLQSTTNLVSPNWQDVATGVVDSASEHTVTIPVSPKNEFFRLKK